MDCSYSIQDSLCSRISLPIVPRISDRFHYPLFRYLNLSQGQQQLSGMRLVKYFVLQSFPQILLPAPCPADRRIAPTELTFKPLESTRRPSHAADWRAGKSQFQSSPSHHYSFNSSVLRHSAFFLENQHVELQCLFPSRLPPTDFLKRTCSPLQRAPKKTISNSISYGDRGRVLDNL